MRRLLGCLVAVLGFAAPVATPEAGERWSPKIGRCDALSWFCAGPRGGLDYRGPPTFRGVPSYARPDLGFVRPPVARPWPPVRGDRAVRPPPRGAHPGDRPLRGFAWRGLDDRSYRLYRPDPRPTPHHRFRWERR